MGPPTTSRQLIEHAIDLYASGFERLRRAVSDDPDIGAGPRFVSGLRSLKARLDAQPFTLERRIVERYRSIVEEAPVGRGVDREADWLESFPRRVLELLDRRGTLTASSEHGRRWLDRVVAARSSAQARPTQVSKPVAVN